MKTWRKALRIALKCTNANAVEISTAMEAIGKNSPIADVRVARALSRAVSNGGAAGLSDEDKSLVYDTIATINGCRQAAEYPSAGEKPAVIRLPPTTMARKRAYLQAANGQPLAEWMFEQCDRAAGYKQTGEL